MTAHVLKSDDARTRWREILDSARAGDDTVIERYDEPVAVLIPFVDYEALVDELDDLRAGRRAQAALDAWARDPSRAKPLTDVEAELRAEGLLDE